MTWRRIQQDYLIRFWAPLPSIIAAGVLSAFYFGITGTFWAVTGEFTRWGGHVLQAFGLHPEHWSYFKIIGLHGAPWTRIDGVMVLGMFAGSLSAALWANNVKLRFPRRQHRIVQALVGGAIAGFGARLAMGCNLAAFFTGIPQFSLHAWLFALSTIVGSYFGTRVALLRVLKAEPRLERVAAGQKSALPARQPRWQFRIGVAVFAAALAASLALAFGAEKLGLAAAFGIAFGVLIERAQICFTSAFRDMWITGRTTTARTIVLGMAASAIGVFSYVQLGVVPNIFWAGPNAIIGGVMFGFGIVVAGGCETGWMYRAMEGQVHYWWVGVGNILGGTLIAALWDRVAPVLVLDYPPVNLLNALGPMGGLIATYAGLVIAFALLLWWEKTFLERAQTRTLRQTEPGSAI
ncbi:MAG: YeeE/YedE family protein [Paraburkholderia sp.]|uniref:selenium metabolism membrane protein YedE/FdhT n=1 Tax=Paraburkholderia sp. TaxID=1926495 RepID=UPI001206BB7E|nr:selenium metabolism membrane protein YedE/FdhT [Paraburkholderia sp.]TAM07313.1 MAG: YeeE/YedE family protein [Paraburkholderia sp.]TAM30808.1 MAG: YeeE/YedE family protein [Paraburkholderia sp.]